MTDPTPRCSAGGEGGATAEALRPRPPRRCRRDSASKMLPSPSGATSRDGPRVHTATWKSSAEADYTHFCVWGGGSGHTTPNTSLHTCARGRLRSMEEFCAARALKLTACKPDLPNDFEVCGAVRRKNRTAAGVLKQRQASFAIALTTVPLPHRFHRAQLARRSNAARALVYRPGYRPGAARAPLMRHASTTRIGTTTITTEPSSAHAQHDRRCIGTFGTAVPFRRFGVRPRSLHRPCL